MRVALILAAGFLVLFVGGGARFAIGLTFKPLVDEFGWARGQLGLAVALYMVVSAFATLIAGRLADRLGARTLLVAGMVIGGAGMGLMSLISAPWHAMLLYGLVFAIGNGAASLSTVGVMVTRAVAGRTGMANALVISGSSVGQLVMIAALAAALTQIGWRWAFIWLALAHLALVPLLVLALPKVAYRVSGAAPHEGLSVREAMRTRRFWQLLAIYAICGMDDFFVTTHMVAFAQDRGVNTLLAGNLLALMGLTALVGVLVAGVASDRSGPVVATAAAFGARILVFGLIAVDQSPVSIAIFALVFGATFLVTAPLAVLFVRDHFGLKHLGMFNGIVNMTHQIFGAIGAYGGALVFDAAGSYDAVFMFLLVASAIALVLSLTLGRTATVVDPPSPGAGSNVRS